MDAKLFCANCSMSYSGDFEQSMEQGVYHISNNYETKGCNSIVIVTGINYNRIFQLLGDPVHGIRISFYRPYNGITGNSQEK